MNALKELLIDQVNMECSNKYYYKTIEQELAKVFSKIKIPKKDFKVALYILFKHRSQDLELYDTKIRYIYSYYVNKFFIKGLTNIIVMYIY